MWLKIKVLLWKSLQLRKRHWLNTLLEIVSPCLFFYLLCYAMSISITNKLIKDQIISKRISEDKLLQYSKFSPIEYIIYTPKTNETNQIMNLVANNLKIGSKFIKSVNSENKMIMVFQENNSEFDSTFGIYAYGIVFEEIKKLHVFNYKIRTKTVTTDDWFIQKIYTYVFNPYFINQKYLSIQLALDKAFIHFSISDNNSSSKSNYNLSLQLLPYVGLKKHMKNQQLFATLFPSFTVLSFLIMCSYTIHRISEEKESGAKKYMKMMGLKSWMIWTGWILHNLFLYVIPITIITYLSCSEIFSGKEKLLRYTNPLLMWIFLTIYMITESFFCFAISSLFNQPLIALMVGDISWFLSFMVPLYLLKTSSIQIKKCFMLLPNSAVINVYETLSFLEAEGIGLQLDTLFMNGKENKYISIGFALIMLIIDCFLFGFITWYLDIVMPGEFGIAKPYSFLCRWANKKIESIDLINISDSNSSRYFEKQPTKFEVGISVRNLHKRFGDIYAVNGVNLDLYKGQITALLGHNGAGKTTTLSICSGLISPSSGSVQFNGNDLFDEIDRYKVNFGLCPQHNLLFSYLTTLDHLILYGMLKGMKFHQVKLESNRLLKLLNMFHKKNELVSKLSGGMKRTLSLAIALVGSPEILILDEPTSGMDPQSRREVWNLLLSFRGTKTILITTQFMEEADVLGDRIAIMAHGQLKCYGTSLFLKKAYGTGYNLTIVKDESCSESNIEETIKNIIPEIKIQSSWNSQMVINLQDKDIDKFPDLFRILEIQCKYLCIKGMGISFTTMDEVFLRSCANGGDEPEFQLPNNDTNQHFNIRFKCYTYITLMFFYVFIVSKILLLKNQFNVLLRKKVLYTYRRWLKIILILGFIPYLICIIAIISTDYLYHMPDITKGVELSLRYYQDSSVYYHASDDSSDTLEPYFVAITKESNSTIIKASAKNNTINDLLHMCKEDERKYRTKLMIAGDFNITNLNIIFNGEFLHTPAIAVNLYTNALLRKLTGNNKSYIKTVNKPILQGRMPIVQLALCIVMCTSCLSYLIGYFIALPLYERVSGIKHIQIMTNLSPFMYWATCFIWDFFCYIIFVIYTLMFIYIIDTDHIFTGSDQLGVLVILLLIYGWSSIFYVYVFSFIGKSLPYSMLLFILINLVIEIFTYLKMGDYLNLILEKYTMDLKKLDWNIIWSIILFIPQFSYPICIDSFLKQSMKNHRAKYFKKYYSNNTFYEYKQYFEFKSEENEFGFLKEMIFLLFSSLFYIILIILFEYKIFPRLYQFGCNKIARTHNGYNNNNEDVNNERDKVDAINKSSYDSLSPILIVDNLVKKFSFKFSGVRSLSFAVLPSECFGLLGVNGSGKTTTYRLLTGDTIPSQGDALIQSNKFYKLSNCSNNNQYLSLIGYCPQFDALNGHLTGKETLELMAILRGISPSNTEIHVDKWIELMGLEEYKDRLCVNYSGGNKRKLNTAMALIGDPPVILLDEPTSGVDPVSRRKLWRIFDACKKRGQAVVITSHSMDECETLCDRLTIMVDGEMKCIGNLQYLKNLYGQGFTVMIKFRSINDNRVNELKDHMKCQFSPGIILKDEHKGLLHYRITKPNILLSKIFGRMNEIKENYSEIEDYTITGTTLEQLFMELAKKQEV